MKPPEMNGSRRYIKYAIVALIVILILLSIFLVLEYRSLRRAQMINAREFWLSATLRNHGPLTVNDVSVIRPWMTFDYINKLFKVPSDYLKDHLSILDAHYPQLSITGYARYNHLDITTFMNQTENALKDYLTNSGT